jgi:hypothetical protein
MLFLTISADQTKHFKSINSRIYLPVYVEEIVRSWK